MNQSLKKLKLFAPVIFWLFQLTVHMIRNIYLLADHSFSFIFENIIYTYPLDILTFCIFYYWLSPKFLKREKLLSWVTIGISYFIVHSFLWTLVYYLRGTDIERLTVIYLSSMGHNLLYAFYGIIINLAIDRFQKREEKKELEKQQIKTELALLRTQINPHFLFNILNNINSFALQKSDKASYAVIKLSEIMRYMLYESSKELVFIDREISYIEHYLDLQKLRYEKKDFIEFKTNISGQITLIPPMLFIPFIENAFKHGKKIFRSDKIKKTEDQQNKIQISISTTEHEIKFYCKNMKREHSDTEKEQQKGIGIYNIKKRLDLLYPGKHYLKINESEDFFEVNLSINP